MEPALYCEPVLPAYHRLMISPAPPIQSASTDFKALFAAQHKASRAQIDVPFAVRFDQVMALMKRFL